MNAKQFWYEFDWSKFSIDLLCLFNINKVNKVTIIKINKLKGMMKLLRSTGTLQHTFKAHNAN